MMKSSLIIFLTFFIICFFIGLIKGYHSEPESDKFLAEACEHIKIITKKNNKLFLRLPSENNKKIFFDYDISANSLHVCTSETEVEEHNLFPLASDELLEQLFIGSLGVPTLDILLKSKKTINTKKTLKYYLAAIVGAVSGYTLGYYIGRPKYNDHLIYKLLKEEKQWFPFLVKLLRRRCESLSTEFYRIEFYLDKKKPLSYTENGFARSSGYSLDKLQMATDEEIGNNLTCLLNYTERKYEWLKGFYKYLKLDSKARSEILFKDDYFGKEGYYFQHLENLRKDKTTRAITIELDYFRNAKVYTSQDVYIKIEKLVDSKHAILISKLMLNKEYNSKIKLALARALQPYQSITIYRNLKRLKVKIEDVERVELEKVLETYKDNCFEFLAMYSDRWTY